MAKFVHSESESAFSELVQRYVALVYSTALRFSSNPHHAEEITQAVFITLARKAGTLSSRVVLSGWLYQTARLTAANFVKGEVRRSRREQEVYMQSTLPHPESADWDKIAPLLDAAMGKLGETDRNALVMRFFENRTAAEIGAVLRMNEEAARKRMHRALEKLREYFSNHGVNSSAETIGGAISANSVRAVPAELAAVISSITLSKINSLPVLSKTMTLFQKTFATTAVATAVGLTVYALHLQKQNDALQRQQAAFTGQLQQLQLQLNDASNEMSSLTDENASLKTNSDELLRLRAEVTQLHQGDKPPASSVPQPHDPQLQIFIQSGFYFVPDSDLQSMGIQWTIDPQGGQIGYLDAPQLKDIHEALNGASDVTTLTMPRLVMINGQKAEMSVSSQYFLINPTNTSLAGYLATNVDQNLAYTNFGAFTNLGEFLSAQPFYSTNSSTFDLNFDFQLKDLTGDPSQPTVQTIQMTNEVTFATGKTLVLEQPVPPGSWMPNVTNLPAGPQDLLVLVTPKIVDPKQLADSLQQQQ
ncbi:MAG TPA: sigma-70 family RNA polymerase sigma factor [Verrucomicrobiae bacterium]